MGIRKLYDEKDDLEDRVFYINQVIKERWLKLIGFGCGYFEDWCISNDIVEVRYEHRGDCGVDSIPIKFFEIKDSDKAKISYDLYTTHQKEEKELEREREKECKEKKLLEKLKKKYGGVAEQ